jgi:(p)ppGpp synthase/HD superfamily hydrolase
MLKKINAILENPGNREMFFYKVGQIFPTRDPRYRLIERAYNVCKDAFRGMTREDQTRVFEHLRGVALIQMDYLYIRDAQIIAEGLMHDLPEDKKEWPISRIEQEFKEFERYFLNTPAGWHLPLNLEYIRKPAVEEYETKMLCLHVYHNHLAVAPREVLLSKIPDRYFNLWSQEICPREKILRKIVETEEIYLPLAKRELILVHEIEAQLENLKAGLSL